MRAGLTQSTFGGELAEWFEDNGQSFEYRPAFTTGIFLLAQFSEYAAFQTELLYVRRGTHFTNHDATNFTTEQGAHMETTYSINYIDMPLLLKFSLPADQYLLPFLYAGPVLCIRLGTMRQKTVVTTPQERNGGNWYDGDNISTQDFAFAIGGGLDCNVGPGRIQADLRYTMSFGEIYPVPSIDIRNRTFLATLGYAWKLDM